MEKASSISFDEAFRYLEIRYDYLKEHSSADSQCGYLQAMMNLSGLCKQDIELLKKSGKWEVSE